MLRCDGGRACINIANFVFINYNNFSIPKLNDHNINDTKYININATMISTLNIDIRFGGGNWETLSDVFEINVDDLFIQYQVFCTAYYSCIGISIYRAENVYCNAEYSCRAASIINTHDSIWIYGSAGLRDGIITNVTNDIHLLTESACDSCIITNVYGSIYALAPWALYSATIRNAYGSIFFFAPASARAVNVANTGKVYCTDSQACTQMVFTSVRLIVVTAGEAINGTIISDMASYTMEHSAVRTMTVKLYGMYTYGALTIFCSVGDTCKIGCFNEYGCDGVYLKCYGTCLLDCDNGESYTCPNVAGGGSYSIWYSNESITETDAQEDSMEPMLIIHCLKQIYPMLLQLIPTRKKHNKHPLRICAKLVITFLDTTRSEKCHKWKNFGFFVVLVVLNVWMIPIQNIGNGICNEECNNTYCSYDNYECINDDFQVWFPNDTIYCNVNDTTDYNYNSSDLCPVTWVADQWCDSNCFSVGESCFYDGYDCECHDQESEIYHTHCESFQIKA